MRQALYRDYRPKSFDEVVGQDHITRTLKNAISKGRISHAYLFTGPRGVGKTSVARILAHEVNNIDYKDEAIDLDIIEIDAASNRRIDEIRELRERVRIAPAAAKYKVYIIDEVHMLTREAFNALLKTLEEPPAHCIFILATTEAHKLPDTIVSRTQRFEFKPVDQANAAAHLASIAKHEKIKIEPAALEILADYGQGSFRDSISYLDQLSSYAQTITADDVRQLLGLPAEAEISQLGQLVAAADAAGVIEQLRRLEQAGVSPPAIAASLAANIRTQIGQTQTQVWQVQLLAGLLDVSASHRPKDSLEIALLSSVVERAGSPQPAEPILPAEPVASAPKVTPEPVQNSTPFTLADWGQVIEHSKSEAASIYTALRLAEPSLAGNKLTLSFEFPLHQKKLDQAKNKDLVSQLIERLFGQKLAIEPVLADKPKPTTASPAAELSQPITAISNIFGGAEVLEA